MPLKAIDHVQLAMPAHEEERARAFYSGVLGLREQSKPADLAGRDGVWFEHGMLKVHLGVEEDFRPAKKAHLAFLVEDLQEILEACTRAGYKVVQDEPLAGYERVYVYDPFGNRLELMEPTSSTR